MKLVKEINLDGTAQYFNAKSFSKTYFSKVSNHTYIVYVEFDSNKIIKLNTTPVHLSKANYLQHKFLNLLLDAAVRVINVDAFDGGLVDGKFHVY